jgi:hypothetical protein
MQNLKRNPKKICMDLSTCNQKQILEFFHMFNRIKSTLKTKGLTLEIKTQKMQEKASKNTLKT